mgnify:CR=1
MLRGKWRAKLDVTDIFHDGIVYFTSTTRSVFIRAENSILTLETVIDHHKLRGQP